MTPAPLASEVFPQLICCTKLVDGQTLFDVNFYPYPTADDDQIFAVTGGSHVFVCRPKLDADPPFEVLRWFRNENTTHAFNSVVWTKDPITKKPWLCLAGEKPKQIQLLDVEKAEPVRRLTGHGNAVNDLAVSPLSSNLLASASNDYTIRIWNLEPEYEDQPCVAIFAGEGHRQPVLACHFHPNGRWMLSAGLDTAVCLWAVPSLELQRNHPQEGHQAPKTVYYPHFHSTEVHANYIDCVVFYGDFILSRAAKDSADKNKSNELLLWRIDGFDSEDDPASEPPIPSPGVYTRSSFPHDKSSRGFQRLLTFEISNTSRFYLRFGLLHLPEVRPILAMGNEESKFLFWDLQKLEEGYDPNEEKKAKKPRGRKSKAAAADAVNQSNLNRLGELRKEQSVGSSDALSGTADPSSTSISAPPERKYDLGDPFMPLKPHHSTIAHTSLSKEKHLDRHFATCQVAWSPDGTWMVAVGDRGMMCIFHRDKSVV